MRSASAFVVLTDASLLREITDWNAGWPGVVAFALLPALSATHDRGQTDFQADPRVLGAAGTARWWNNNGQLVGFGSTDIVYAITSGNARATRLVFELTETFSCSYRYWMAALAHNPGDCAMLNVLWDFDSKCRERGASPLGTDHLIGIKHAAVARWFVEHFGPTCLPNRLILTALRNDCLGLYYYLRKIPGQVANPLLVESQITDANSRAICALITKCTSSTAQFYGEELLGLITAFSADAELLEQVLADWSSACSAAAVQEATDALSRFRSVTPPSTASVRHGEDSIHCFDFGEQHIGWRMFQASLQRETANDESNPPSTQR